MKSISVIGLLTIVLLISSCRKDNESIIVIKENVEPPKIFHDANLTGKIVDEAGNILSESVVTVLNTSTVSNEEGDFTLSNVKVNAAGSLVKSEVRAYLPAYSPIYADLNGLTDVRIVHRLPLLHKVEGQNELNLAINNQINIKVQNNLFEYANGTPFSEEALVSVELVTEELKLREYPLSLPCLSIELESGVLEAQHILNIMAFDQNGNYLTLKAGKILEVTIVDNDLRNKGVFKLDESSELWQQVTDVAKTENGISIEIEEMGITAFGSFENKSTINGVLRLANGELADFQDVIIKSEFATIKKRTNSKGELTFTGVLYETYTVTVVDVCGNVLLNKQIEATETILNVGNLSIEGDRTEINFELVNCDFTPATFDNGTYAFIGEVEHRYIYKAVDNKFQMKLLYCNESSVMTLKNDVETVKNMDLSKFIDSNSMVDLYNVNLCDNNIAAVIKIGANIKQYNKEEFYILIEELVGSKAYTFTDVSDVTLSMYDADVIGVFDVKDFESTVPEVIACTDDCGSLKLKVTLTGSNVGDRVVAHLFGEYKEKKVFGYFDDTIFK